MRRVAWFIGVMVGILLVAAAGVVRWTVAPAVTVLPSDTNTTRVYTGTADSLFNPTALTGAVFGPAMLHNIPATVQNRVKVMKTKGDNAIVSDRRIVSVPGHTVADVTDWYAVDRKTIDRGTGFEDVTAQTGVTFNWPIHTQKRDYTGWVPDTMTTSALHYAGVAKRGGITTYVFTTNVAPQRITNPRVLAALPKSMTKQMLDTMAGTLGMTRAQLENLATLTPKLPDPVPFVYTFAADSTYWVAPASGVVVDVQSHELRMSNVVVDGALVPLSPLLDLTYTSPSQTLQAAAGDAKDKAAQMTMIETTLPLTALIAGAVILLVLAPLPLIRRRRPPAPSVTSVAPPRELTPAG